MMMKTSEGALYTDFFGGLYIPPGSPTGSKSPVGAGNAVLPIPMPLSSMIEYLPALASFARDFPEYMDTEFTLTFKECYGNRVEIGPVPPGLAYIWIQTAMDGNRVTQLPFTFKFTSEVLQGKTVLIPMPKDLRELFYFL